MRPITGVLAVALVGCAASPSSEDGGPVARCSVTDCFNGRAVRGFDVLDERTAVVYVGSQRCPFVVALDGFDCNLSVTPELRFYEAVYGSTTVAETTGQICATRDALYVYTGISDPGLGNGLTGAPTRPGQVPDVFGTTRSAGTTGLGSTVDVFNNNDFCRVRTIRSITDDELVELRVGAGMPPPPPVPQGTIEVPETPAGPADATQAGGDEAPVQGSGDTSGAGEEPRGGGAAGEEEPGDTPTR
jgi:hypothetical protein